MQTLSVSELNSQIKGLLEATFLQVSVCGEVSNCTYHSSGHIYFSIKDKDSILKCVMFRGNARYLKFKIEDGMDLTLNGGITLFIPRGEYQLNCFSATPSGVGELTLAYEQLKKEYEKKGYFLNKKPLPKFPKKVGLITSKSGAVLHDMLRVANKRWNLVEFILFDTLVQGEGAKENIVKNIQIADSLNLDCLILARGGGSLEDLWAFNEPLVNEAIFLAKTPIISAIGHEPDVVLSDFVADLRAPTPSAAMEILLPDKIEWLMRLDSMQKIMEDKIKGFLEKKNKKLEYLRVLLQKNSFFEKIKNHKQQLLTLQKFLTQAIESKIIPHRYALESTPLILDQKITKILTNKINQITLLKTKLESKNPQNNQKKGYVYASFQGKPILKLSKIKPNCLLTLEDLSASVEVQVLNKKLIT
ncbi:MULTISPECIES: exodeoxyribonuclease VII large subunit [Helicobacter]|uniref:exodeoxyribonuclease VII large subunit n=1 Tax=Helicobacter TaxID=209 RepID=UPI001F56FEA3|nr:MULTISPECIES: exodeoxyribonuclease VII large subunit [Helicobacter]MCI2236229.1 exodeoxyribonuclease VII large subunit [Helicobacter sp. CaF467b]MCI7046557.1 exodeoxyribonuclease VII large subunit [Helicobacter sp.]MCI7765816.1 exodeoxyribonuclease VII large subunit [Helicobacter sp.]MCL9820414.1 exodeoxyribonuclease VII large subunit [Helicobacter colisuis]MDY4425761.1 exodeoxyribonuclease VII large subunit [Helicobacter sp.]